MGTLQAIDVQRWHNFEEFQATPQELPWVGMATEVAVSDGTTAICVLRNDHTVRCTSPQGTLFWPGSCHPEPGESSCLVARDIDRLYAGAGAFCGTRGHTLTCWGKNDRGQATGHPSGPVSSFVTELPVSDGVTIDEVAIANGRGCALTSEREVFCWGENSTQQLLHDRNFYSLAPTRIPLP